jgi:lysophospholipase L1-like esterase
MTTIRAITSGLLGLIFAHAIPHFANAETAPVPVQDYQPPIRLACVGDSITAGVGAGKGWAYPAQLARMLGDKWDVQNFGVSGSTMLKNGDRPYFKQAAFQKALEFKPHIVVIMLGTNDTKPQNWSRKGEYFADYKEMVGKFQELESKPRIYISRPCPVPGNGNFGINEAGVLEAIPMIDKLASEQKLGLIDMHAALNDHPEFLPDRVHPNTQGATEMAKAAYHALTGMKFTGEVPPPAAAPAQKPAK